MSKAEKQFVISHPSLAKTYYDNAKKASQAVTNLPGQHNGVGDAVRHAYWSALNTRDSGFHYAKLYGDAHEDKPESEQPLAEKLMDLHNNSIGYEIGRQAKENNWSDSQIWDAVIKAKNDEKLQTHL